MQITKALKLEVAERLLKWLQREGETNWIKGDYAQNRQGHLIDWESSSACKFCISGRIRKEAVNVSLSHGQYNLHYHLRQEILNDLDDLLGSTVIKFNDSPYTKLNDMIDVITKLRNRYSPRKSRAKLADNTDTTMEE